MTPEEINRKIDEYFWPGIMDDKDYPKRPTDYFRSNATDNPDFAKSNKAYKWAVGI